MSSTDSLPLVLGVSGASGMIYAVRALRHLLLADLAVDLVASRAAAEVWRSESQIPFPSAPELQEKFWREQAGVPDRGHLVCHRSSNVGARIASG